MKQNIGVNHTKVYGKTAYYAIKLAVMNRAYNAFAFNSDKFENTWPTWLERDVLCKNYENVIVTDDNEVCVTVPGSYYLSHKTLSNFQLRKTLLNIINKLHEFKDDEPLVFFFMQFCDSKLFSNKQKLLEKLNKYHYFINKDYPITIADLRNVAEQLKTPTLEGKEDDVFKLELKQALIKDMLLTTLTVPPFASSIMYNFKKDLANGDLDEFITCSDHSDRFVQIINGLVDSMMIYEGEEQLKNSIKTWAAEYSRSDEFNKFAQTMKALADLDVDVKILFKNQFSYNIVMNIR